MLAAPRAAGPFARTRAILVRLRVRRLLLVAALLAAIALVLVEAPVVTARGVPLVLAFGLAVPHAGAIPAALRAPNLAAPVSLAAVLVLQALTAATTAPWPWSPVLIVTQTLVLAAVGTRTRLPTALLHWLLAVGLSAVLAARLRPGGDSATAVDLVVFGGVSVSVMIVAFLLAQWRRVRDQLLHERQVAAEESELRVLAEERARIARELHDVVAHSLSIITVQSSTARFRHRDLGDETAGEFDRIAAHSRQALDEMRGLLKVLRGTDDDLERRPQPGLGEIAGLVQRTADSGATITLDQPVDASLAGIGPLTGLTAFRIVQEGISNALRHASGCRVAVSLQRRGGELEVSVVNTAGRESERPSVDRPGHGLVGMRERVASIGGTVVTAATPDGGFAVRALLPIASGAR